MGTKARSTITLSWRGLTNRSAGLEKEKDDFERGQKRGKVFLPRLRSGSIHAGARKRNDALKGNRFSNKENESIARQKQQGAQSLLTDSVQLIKSQHEKTGLRGGGT